MKKFWLENKKTIGYIFTLFILWTFVVNFLDWISPHIPINHRGGYNYLEFKIINPSFFWNRANFDGIHYLDISRKGYDIHQQAFFPLYPKVIEFLKPVFKGKDLIAGLTVSHFSLIFFLFIFYKLIRLDFDDKVARLTLFFLIIFPTSFFFGFLYTESLFLLFILGSFYAARKNKWLIAGILGALAANTRLVGVFLFPALLYEWYEENNFKNLKLKIKNLLSILLVPLGLLYYMRYLKINFNDPLMFIHSQPFFGANRSGGKIILLYQVFYRYLKMIFTTKLDPLYFTVWLELLIAIGFMYLLYRAYREKIRSSYLIFAFLSLIMPTLTGTFSSIPRYVLVLFPCFIYLGMIKNKKLKIILISIFGFLAVFGSMLFFKGYWIA